MDGVKIFDIKAQLTERRQKLEEGREFKSFIRQRNETLKRLEADKKF